MPTLESSAADVVLRTRYLSVDPYMRCMFDPGHPQLGEYLEGFALGAPLHGGGIGEVVESSNPAHEIGDVLCAPFLGYQWARYVALDTTDEQLNLHNLSGMPAPALALGALGIPGLTSYFCMLARGDPQPGETVVVSGAAGACGTIAGQLAKIRGARVVAICGTAQKCHYLQSRLGFDEAIDYKDTSEPLSAKLHRVCGDSGVDVYMDNVGGATSEAVLALMNEKGRVPICGQISEYNNNVAYSALLSADSLPTTLQHRLAELSVERGRFLVLDHQSEFDAAVAQLSQWVTEGQLLAPQTIFAGFTPGEAFVEMMQGANIGKAVVEIDGVAGGRRIEPPPLGFA